MVPLMVTPSRVCQRLSIPELDSKPQLDDLATALTYGGLHTPPSSANESRRPSAQYPWVEPPCSASPAAELHYSQTTTPVHRPRGEHDGFKQDWFESDCAQPGSAWRVIGTPFLDHRHGTGSVMNTHISESTPHYSGSLALGMECPSEFMPVTPWTQAGDPTRLLAAAQSTYLGPELFPTTQSLVLRPHDQMRPETPGFAPSFEVVTTPSRHHGGIPLGPSPPRSQVVVPSQLGSQDLYCHSHLVGYGSPEHGSETSASGFASSLHSSFGSFEALEPPSPMDTGMEPADDDDYSLLKREDVSREVKQHAPITRGAARLARKRYAKRPRGGRGPWHRHEVGGIEVQCEGKHFPLDGSHKYDTAKTDKKYVCAFMLNGNKCCGKQFDRSEHLKRHFGSHTNERPYFCPLPTCERRIERSDNACDHFKSHIKPEKPGKRNRHVEWPELHMAILEKYDDKKRADKLIENLQRWVEMGMPDKTSERMHSNADLDMESVRGPRSHH